MQEAEREPESLAARALAPLGARLDLAVLALYDDDGRRLGGLGGPAALAAPLAERLRRADSPSIDEPPARAWGLGGGGVAAFPIRRPPVRATLVAAADRPGGLPPPRLDFLRALADRLGLAVRDARLAADLRAHSIAVEYLNREMARSVEDLRRSADLKSRFVSTVSHELRTPLASIRMHAETILEAIADLSRDEVRDFVAVIAQESERLSRLIADTLDLSRLLAGRRPIQRAPVDLTEVVERVAGTLAPVAAGKGVAVEVVPAAGRDAVVPADRDAVIQALTNVLGNAVKYAGRGNRQETSGRVRAEVRPADEEVAVEVADTGPGIAPEHLPHVFEEFYKADATGAEEGTGLGLAITKAIVEGHGGSVHVESEVGRGSVFTLRFPRRV
jgi:signal transduction histidine kinase